MKGEAGANSVPRTSSPRHSFSFLLDLLTLIEVSPLHIFHPEMDYSTLLDSLKSPIWTRAQEQVSRR